MLTPTDLRLAGFTVLDVFPSLQKQQEKQLMSFKLTSIPHAIATGFEDTAKGLKATAEFIEDHVEPSESTVETITAMIPGIGAEAETIERAGFAALGVVCALLDDSTNTAEDGVAAATAMFKNAGADETLIADFKALYAKYKPQISKLVASVEKK